MNDVHFLVGKTPNGETVLRVGDSVSTTLTMGQNSTVDLIKLLASTLDDDKWKFNIKIDPKGESNE
jgi:hypothetical protein